MKTGFIYQTIIGAKLDSFTRLLYRNKLRIIMFHGIIDDDIDLDCWWLLKKSKFLKQVDFLSRNFTIISLDDALSLQMLPKNSCVLTFDDGYKSMLTHVYPVLKERNIPFTVYVTTGPVSRNELIWTDAVFLALENRVDGQADHLGIRLNTKDRKFKMVFLNHLKRMDPKEKNCLVMEILNDGSAYQKVLNKGNPFEMLTVEDVKTLAADPLVTIGAHTVNHEILTRIPLEDAVREIWQSKEALEKWTGQKILHFAYPDGKFNQMLAEKVRELGFKCAVRIGLRINRKNKPFELCRIGTAPTDDDTMFRAMINGIIPLKVEVRDIFRQIWASVKHLL